jgi:hypothetical protein
MTEERNHPKSVVFGGPRRRCGVHTPFSPRPAVCTPRRNYVKARDKKKEKNSRYQLRSNTSDGREMEEESESQLSLSVHGAALLRTGSFFAWGADLTDFC